MGTLTSQGAHALEGEQQFPFVDYPARREPLLSTRMNRRCLACGFVLLLLSGGGPCLSRQLREAHGYLGDPAPMISKAEAFVLHGPSRKGLSCAQAVCPLFMQGRDLLIVRITSRDTSKCIPLSHMRTLTCAAKDLTSLSEQFATSGMYAHELHAAGWPDHLVGSFALLAPIPVTDAVSRKLPVEQGRWTTRLPAIRPHLSSCQSTLASRPAFQWGIVGQEIFAGWGGWTKGLLHLLLHQGFSCREPVELYQDPVLLTPMFNSGTISPSSRLNWVRDGKFHAGWPRG